MTINKICVICRAQEFVPRVREDVLQLSISDILYDVCIYIIQQFSMERYRVKFKENRKNKNILFDYEIKYTYFCKSVTS